MKTIKIQRGVITGSNPPAHLLVAYGRHIFRLFHVLKPVRGKVNLWLRDLPLSILELESEYGRSEAWEAYCAECDRVGIPESERIGA